DGGRGSRDAKAELQSPDSGDDDGVAAGVAHLAEEVTRIEVEGVDRAVTEVAHEQGIVEVAEALKGRPGHAPGRVELALTGEPGQQVPSSVENVDEPVSRPRDVVFLVGVLHGVGDVEMAVDGRDAERSEPGWDVGILERVREVNRSEVGVEDID